MTAAVPNSGVAADDAPLRGWVVSVDLWGTLITYGDRDAEAAWRLREFATVLTEFGHPVPPGRLAEVVLGVCRNLRDRQRTLGEQPAVRDQVAAMVTGLGIPTNRQHGGDGTESDQLVEVLLVAHTHAALRACPDPIPGAAAALRALRTAEARVVLTSNTLATPGAVTREIVEGCGLGGLFDDVVFSGDVGVAKPRPELFHVVAARGGVVPGRVVHVGDDWAIDVLGAVAAGCAAIFFNPRGEPSRPQAPDVTDLAALPRAVHRLRRADAEVSVGAGSGT